MQQGLELDLVLSRGFVPRGVLGVNFPELRQQFRAFSESHPHLLHPALISCISRGSHPHTLV